MKIGEPVYVYSRKEIFFFLFLILLGMLFLFTLGLHFGKQLQKQPCSHSAIAPKVSVVKAASGSLPSVQQLLENKPNPDQMAEEAQKILHEEVTQSNIHLEKEKTVYLPKTRQ